MLCRPSNPPPPPSLPPAAAQPLAGKSFAAALSTQPKPRFQKLEIPNRNKVSRDGKPALLFSPAEIKAGAVLLQYVLIAKFSAGKLKTEVIKQHIQSSWKLAGPFSTGSLDGRHELIILDSPGDAIQALACSSHQIGDFLFRLFRWTPDFSIKRESAMTAVWVRVPQLNILFFNEGFLRHIGDAIGTFLKADDRTLSRSCPACKNSGRSGP